MRWRLGLPVRNVSASGLGDLCFSSPVADATGKDVSASGLKRLIGVEAPVAHATGRDVLGDGLKDFSPEGGIRTAGVVRPRMWCGC